MTVAAQAAQLRAKATTSNKEGGVQAIGNWIIQL